MRLLAACCCIAIVGCSAGKDTSDDPLNGGRDGSTEGGIDIDGGLLTDATLDGMKAGPLGCSGDLQSVTDEMGIVQKRCPPDQGCFKGECIPACEAAAKSKGNVGCDFLAATPSFYPTITPPCFAVFLANNWSKPVKITVSRGGASYRLLRNAGAPSRRSRIRC